MTYRVIVAPAARRMINDLPREVKGNVFRHILALELDPRPHGVKKLVGQATYRIRVGDYRIVYTINDEAVTVTVVRVGHRRDVYR